MYSFINILLCMFILLKGLFNSSIIFLQLVDKLNEVDNRGDLPLDLALSTKQESIATTLVKHKVDVNRRDNTGKCLLHKAIKRGW